VVRHETLSSGVLRVVLQDLLLALALIDPGFGRLFDHPIDPSDPSDPSDPFDRRLGLRYLLLTNNGLKGVV